MARMMRHDLPDRKCPNAARVRGPVVHHGEIRLIE